MNLTNMAKDYCVDCSYFDNEDCWVCFLPVKYEKVVHIVKPNNVLDIKNWRSTGGIKEPVKEPRPEPPKGQE